MKAPHIHTPRCRPSDDCSLCDDYRAAIACTSCGGDATWRNTVEPWRNLREEPFCSRDCMEEYEVSRYERNEP